MSGSARRNISCGAHLLRCSHRDGIPTRCDNPTVGGIIHRNWHPDVNSGCFTSLHGNLGRQHLGDRTRIRTTRSGRIDEHHHTGDDRGDERYSKIGPQQTNHLCHWVRDKDKSQLISLDGDQVGASSGARMRPSPYLAEAVCRHVGVDLCGGY